MTPLQLGVDQSCFGLVGDTGDISLVEGRMDSSKYRQILEANITPSVKS